MQHKPLTVGALIALLSEYPADTPILTGKGYDLFPSAIQETTFDDWAHATPGDEPGYDIPAVGRALAIGPRF